MVDEDHRGTSGPEAEPGHCPIAIHNSGSVSRTVDLFAVCAASPAGYHGVMLGSLSPGSGGPLVDPDGGRWAMSRRDLDIRLVRRAMRSPERRVLLGEDGGSDLAWVGPDHRPALWERMKDRYFGPGGTEHGVYSGYEFVNDDGDSLIYIEVWCY